MDKDLLRKVANRIKELRKLNNYTQDDLAFYSGVPRSTIGNLETVKNDVVLSKIIKIAQAFNLTLAEFFDFEDK